MKKTLILISILLVFLALIPTVYAEPFQTEWYKIYGNYGREEAYSIDKTSDGSYIATGTSLGPGLWFAKLDSDGNVNWEGTDTRIGCKEDGGYAIHETSDMGFAIAGITYCGYGIPNGRLIKTDPQGNIQWDKIFGNRGRNEFKDMKITSDGGYILAGYTEIYPTDDQEYYWLVKTNSQGNQEWEKTFGPIYTGYPSQGINSVQQTLDGGYILIGIAGMIYNDNWDDPVQRPNRADHRVWIIKTDSQGNKEWEKEYTRDTWAYGEEILQLEDKSYVFVGSHSVDKPFDIKDFDIWVVKLDEQGNQEWEKQFYGEKRDFGRSIKQTSDGGYIIAGDSSSFGLGSSFEVESSDAIFIKIDENGNEEWRKTFGGTGGDMIYSIVEDDNGDFAAAGYIVNYQYGGYRNRLILKLSPGEKPDSLFKLKNDFLAEVNCIVGDSSGIIYPDKKEGVKIINNGYEVNSNDILQYKAKSGRYCEWFDKNKGSIEFTIQPRYLPFDGEQHYLFSNLVLDQQSNRFEGFNILINKKGELVAHVENKNVPSLSQNVKVNILQQLNWRAPIKIKFEWNNNEIKLYVNGNKVASKNNIRMPNKINDYLFIGTNQAGKGQANYIFYDFKIKNS